MTTSYDQALQLATALSSADRLRLIAALAELAAGQSPVSEDRPAWTEIGRSIPYPALGEDAQEWVSRGRRESDEQRALAGDGRV